MFLYTSCSLYRMKNTKHICCVIAIVFLFLCHFALCAENNDSQLLGIDKKEFTRVISGIIDSGAAGNDDIGRENEENIAEDDYVTNSHRISMQNKGDLREAAVQSRKGVQNKRDSLYFLQRSMQQREGGGTGVTATLESETDHRSGFSPIPSTGMNMSKYSPRSQQVKLFCVESVRCQFISDFQSLQQYLMHLYLNPISNACVFYCILTATKIWEHSPPSRTRGFVIR